jgi:hypothetical protein
MNPIQIPPHSVAPTTLRLGALLLGVVAVAAAMLPLFQAAGAVIA